MIRHGIRHNPMSMPRALFSLTDKSGLVEFASGLAELGYELLSTGGTSRALKEAGLAVREVSELTGFPEMLGGRVKTLHPAVHAALLADTRDARHLAELKSAGFEPILLLCANLYEFEETIAGDHRFEEAVESIDIGGPAMIRAAAKNHTSVVVVVDPADYAAVLAAIRDGCVDEMRLGLAAKAFRHVAFYDSLIARYLTAKTTAGPFPEKLTLGMRKAQAAMRYGENPHQAAALYVDPLSRGVALRQVGGSEKEISYNNWLDAEAAWALASDLPESACVIVKHGNPCGVAIGSSLEEGYRLAKQSDPVSAFGGIVAFHGVIDEPAVRAMTEKGNFLEVVVSRGWESDGLIRHFREGAPWTKNVRFLVGEPVLAEASTEVRSLRGGFLLQQSDEDPGESGWRVVTSRNPSEEEWAAIRLQWAIVRHVRSNAIVVGTPDRLLGVGAGQMNRVRSVRLALEQAGEAAKGASLASDAFFPFPDGVQEAAKAGVGAIVQPGGSKKDEEVVKAADSAGIAMVFTGVRHFRH